MNDFWPWGLLILVGLGWLSCLGIFLLWALEWDVPDPPTPVLDEAEAMD